MSAFSADELRRIELTTAVRDTDALPKVAGAGSVTSATGAPCRSCTTAC